LRNLPRITPEEIELIMKVHNDECRIQEQKNELKQSVIDPKWKVFEQQQADEEETMLDLYKQFGVDDPVAKLRADS
jgi:hypothetical protein